MTKRNSHTNSIAPCTVDHCDNTPNISLGGLNFCAEHAHVLIGDLRPAEVRALVQSGYATRPRAHARRAKAHISPGALALV